MTADVLVLGTGLVGASVGLALTGAGRDVVLADVEPAAVEVAVRRGAGRPWDSKETVRVALVAVPPRVTGASLFQLQRLDVAQTYMHVASVQTHVQLEVEVLKCDLSCIVGTHPMAGRERSGPEAATADLFVGRPWAVCPSGETSDEHAVAAEALVQACGGDVVRLSAEEHDAAVALLSHLPQVTASALASALLSARGQGPDVRLVGPGLIDTTRLAASDAALWTQILELNAVHLAPLVLELAGRLSGLGHALEEMGRDDAAASGEHSSTRSRSALAEVQALLLAGNRGRALVPVKRGAREEAFALVRVSVPDEPGQLAGVLADAAAADVNVEDVHVEHVPGRRTGVIELLAAVDDVAALEQALYARGWLVLARD